MNFLSFQEIPVTQLFSSAIKKSSKNKSWDFCFAVLTYNLS